MDFLTAARPSNHRPPVLSVVVPVYNEQDALGEFHRRLSAALDALALDAEVVYVTTAAPTPRWRCWRRCTSATRAWR
jgi:hypothetical protein